MTRASAALSRDELVAAGRAAVLAGDHARARELLDTAVRIDPSDAEAWTWLSGAQSEPADMAACLRRALTLDPGSELARDGMRWLVENFGEQYAFTPGRQPAHDSQALRDTAGARELAEAAVYPFAAGALLGLTRLAGWLRPESLEQLRLDSSGIGGALLVTLRVAAGHGLVLLALCAALGVVLASWRGRGRDDVAASLVRAGNAFAPGLVWGAALALAAFGLLFAPLVWPAVVALIWAVILVGVVLIGLRLRRLFRAG